VRAPAADFTHIRTASWFAYLAFILDAYPRMVVGWPLASHHRASLVTDALEMAVGLRRPSLGLITGTNAGSQYMSIAYTERAAESGMRPSIGTVGDALDSAVADKLLDAAQKRWRRFSGHELVADVLNGATFTDGITIVNDGTPTTDERAAA
jgi:putative transposase